MTVYATMENLKKYQGRPGLLMYSPYTGEEYSATIGDYFWAPSNARFKDSTGHVMRLGIGQPASVKALNPGVPGLIPTQSSAAHIQTQSFDISHMNPKGSGIRLNEIWTQHARPNEYYVFGRVGSGKNQYIVTLAYASTKADIDRGYNKLLSHLGTPASKIPYLKSLSQHAQRNPILSWHKEPGGFLFLKHSAVGQVASFEPRSRTGTLFKMKAGRSYYYRSWNQWAKAVEKEYGVKPPSLWNPRTPSRKR